MTPAASSDSKNHAHHKSATYAKRPVLTGPSREYLSLLRDAPALVRSMERQGLIRRKGLHLKEDVKP